MNLKSLRQDIMKSSKHVPSFVDPSAQGNMARLEDPVGNMGPPGLPKADNPPQYSQDKALPFRQTFMPCSLSGKEAVDLHSPWSTSRTCVRNGGSQVVHPSTAEGSVTSQLNYRPEDVAFPMDTGSPAAMEELAAKHKFAYYSRSPIEHSPSAAGVVSPVAFRKPPAECMGLSPPSAETSVGLAVPKPVYRHRPCCTDPKCTVGQNYAVDQGLHRVPPPMFEEDWAAHYSHWAYLHKKEQEALMQQRILPFEPCRERVPLKDVPSESYHGLSPGRLRRASAFTEPGHGSYLSSPAHPFLSSPQEHCQRFQMPPQTHSDLRPVYEPLTQMHCGMPTRVYQDHPHTSKYVDVSRRPFLYCPQNNIEIYRPENSHIIDKQASGQCPVPQTYFNDLPKPYSIIPPGHPAIRNVLDYSAYRMHLNASEAVTRVNPLTERPCPRPALPQVDRPLDFSLRREQSAVSHRDPHGPFGSLGAFHQTQSQAQHRVAAESPASSYPGQGRDSFPASSVCDHIAASRCPGDMSNKKQSLHISDKPANSVPLSKRPREETENICEDDDFLEKVQKLDKRQTDETQAPSSPLMPVINKVFSLAPYKTYLEAAGMLLPAQDPSISELPADSDPPKAKSEAQGMDSKANLSQDDLKTKAVTTPPAVRCDAPEIQSLKVKEEKLEEDEASCPSEIAKSPNPAISHHAAQVKKEPADLESAVCDAECSAVVIKTDIKPEYLTVTPELSEPPKTEPGAGDREETVRTQNTVAKSSDLPNMLPSISPAPLQTLQSTFSLSKIPPQCLKLTSYNIVVPEVLRSPMPPIPEVLQSPAEPKTAISSSRRARHQFMELHQSLCVLVSRCVSQTSRQELRSWLSRLDLVSPPTKTQKVSCLLGSKAREAWLRGDETMAALQKVLSQLEKYVRSRECPFLHVIRAGAVFIPMLVVKEALFPQVQGAYIDQVLQEHRVELRPTTLSEERHLTQLHRQSFSSRLRRLLSLKHLPDMYPDVLNLLYYASVCKFLGIESISTFKKECVELSDENESSLDGLEVRDVSLRSHPSHTVTCMENHKEASGQKSLGGKGRVKSACKRVFLRDDSSSSEGESAEEFENWCPISVDEAGWENNTAAYSDEDSHVVVKIEEDTEPENSWGRPLTSDDLSTESSDAEVEAVSCSYAQSRLPGVGARTVPTRRAGMVLKLRKVYYGGRRRGRLPHYQRVTDHPEAQDMAHNQYGHHQGKKTTHRGHAPQYRTRLAARDSFPEACGSRCCPYLPAQRTSKHRRRRGLSQTTRSTYPDLVGKRIRHLYEENDKTEVWYRGVVLRVHEPHANPLKTVFEVKYDSEPEWQYYLELLVDYKKGWLKIED